MQEAAVRFHLRRPNADAAMVSTWERGIHRPSHDHRVLLCATYGMEPEELGLDSTPGLKAALAALPPDWRQPDSLTTTLPGRLALDGEPADGEDPTKRRTLVLGTAAAVLTWWTDPALKAIERIHRLEGTPAAETIDGLEELVSDLGFASLSIRADHLYPRIDALLDYVQQLLGHTALPGNRRRLHSIAGWAAGMAASAQLDLGDDAAARASCRSALLYGQHANDARLMAWARDRQAKIAFYTGDIPAVLRIAAEGLAVSPRPIGIEVGLLGATARAHACLGDTAAVMLTLRQVDDEFARLPASEIGGGLFRISEIYPAACFSTATVWLDEPDLTRQHAQTVIDYFSRATGLSRRPTRLAIAQLDAAVALVQQGKPDEACHLAQLAIGTERMVSSVRTRAGELDAALLHRWPNVAEVRDLHERYTSLGATPARPTLPPQAGPDGSGR